MSPCSHMKGRDAERVDLRSICAPLLSAEYSSGNSNRWTMRSHRSVQLVDSSWIRIPVRLDPDNHRRQYAVTRMKRMSDENRSSFRTTTSVVMTCTWHSPLKVDSLSSNEFFSWSHLSDEDRSHEGPCHYSWYDFQLTDRYPPGGEIGGVFTWRYITPMIFWNQLLYRSHSIRHKDGLFRFSVLIQATTTLASIYAKEVSSAMCRLSAVFWSKCAAIRTPHNSNWEIDFGLRRATLVLATSSDDCYSPDGPTSLR